MDGLYTESLCPLGGGTHIIYKLTQVSHQNPPT